MSDISPPIAVVTPTDHGGLLLIANAFGLCLILFFMLIRICARLFINPPFDRDDIALGVATVLGIVYSAILFSLVSKGFGRVERLISSSSLITVQKLSYASDLFFLFTLWASKCSMGLLFIRLTPRKDHKRVAQGIIAGVTVWLIVSIFLVALRCDLSHPWIFINPKCTDSIVRWDIIGAIDIVSEAVLFAMSILLVKDLKMDMSRKAFVVVAFGLRLPMIAFAVFRLRAASREVNSSDPTFTGTFFIIWSIVEAHFSICSSNIACLKPFMAAFNTSYGGSAEINELSRLDRSGGKSGSGTITSMKYFPRRKKKGGLSSKDSTLVSRMQPEREIGSSRPSGVMGNEVDIIHEDAGSVDSGDSRQMIIQKDVTWDVEYSSAAKPVKARSSAPGQYTQM